MGLIAKILDSKKIVYQNEQALINEARILAGPNSGFALLEESLFKEPQMAGEIPELSGQINLLTEARADLQQLVDVYSAITQTKGMSKAHAKEMHRLIPGLESAVPIGYYTDLPSRTQYKQSLESIKASTLALISAAVAAVIAIIYKFIQWLLGKKPKSGIMAWLSPGSMETDCATVMANHRDLSSERNKLGRALGKVQQLVEKSVDTDSKLKIPDDVRKPATKPATMSQALWDILQENDNPPVDTQTHAPKKLATSPSGTIYTWELYPMIMYTGKSDSLNAFQVSKNPVVMDIAGDGKYSRLMQEGVASLVSVQEALKQRIEYFTEFVNMVNDPQADKRVANSRLKLLDEPFEFTLNNRTVTFSAAALYMQELRDGLKTPSEEEVLDIDELLRVTTKIYTEPTFRDSVDHLGNTLVVIAEAERTLSQLQRRAGNLDTDDNGGLPIDMGPKVREVLTSLAFDVAGLIAYYAEVRYYLTSLDSLAIDLLGIVKTALHAFVYNIKMINVKLPPEVAILFNQFNQAVDDRFKTSIRTAADKYLSDLNKR